jgi:broad specificity phosphatase PhoE
VINFWQELRSKRPKGSVEYQMQTLVTRFGVIRHAETEWNQEGRIQGHADSALTPKGRQDAARWGGILKSHGWHRILSSDLGRALETASVINTYLQVPVESDSRLREQDWGRWTTKTLAQIKVEERQELDRQIDAGWEFCPPHGETRLKLWRRSCAALRDAALKWPGQTILTVTHEGVIKSLIYKVLKRNYLPSEPPLIKSPGLHWLIAEGSELHIEKVNAMVLS